MGERYLKLIFGTTNLPEPQSDDHWFDTLYDWAGTGKYPDLVQVGFGVGMVTAPQILRLHHSYEALPNCWGLCVVVTNTYDTLDPTDYSLEAIQIAWESFRQLFLAETGIDLGPGRLLVTYDH